MYVFIDSTTGIPISGAPSMTYSLNSTTNLNLLLFKELFPDVPIQSKLTDRNSLKSKYNSWERNRHVSTDRQSGKLISFLFFPVYY